jgi:hypothetical protein
MGAGLWPGAELPVLLEVACSFARRTGCPFRRSETRLRAVLFGTFVKIAPVCSEFCGDGHGYRLARAEGLSQDSRFF